MSSPRKRVHSPVIVVAGATHEKIAAHMKRRGISRAQTYLDLAGGKYDAVKDGKTTLIVVASADAYYANLPKAEFNGAGLAGLRRRTPAAEPSVSPTP